MVAYRRMRDAALFFASMVYSLFFIVFSVFFRGEFLFRDLLGESHGSEQRGAQQLAVLRILHSAAQRGEVVLIVQVGEHLLQIARNLPLIPRRKRRQRLRGGATVSDADFKDEYLEEDDLGDIF